MSFLAGVVGVLLIVIVLWDAFEAMVLPRRVTKQIRLTRLFYRFAWLPWSAVARHIRKHGTRETYLSFFGPLSLLVLIVIWAVCLVFGFALLHFSFGHLKPGDIGFGRDLYMSGTTFFTLGLGDITPESDASRVITVLETGMGFAFLALIISYLPVLYGAFSEREINISLLDARAGSPPTATELLVRSEADFSSLTELLSQWERWAAELLESHLSYPVLGFYRSQHSNQSWLIALVAMLDTCAMLIVYVKGAPVLQARFTFAMARHAFIDLAQIYGTPPRIVEPDRLPDDHLKLLSSRLKKSGFKLKTGPNLRRDLDDMRILYEPYAYSLSRMLLVSMPPWLNENPGHDNWESHPWKEFLKMTESRRRKREQIQDHF